MMSKSTVSGGDRLLQARVVVGLGEVDPVDLGAGIGLPRLQEAAEQEVVQVLVVEPHEGQLDAGELAFCDVGLGRAEAQLADLLPVGIGRADPCRRPGSCRICARRSSCAEACRVSAPSGAVDAAASAAMLAAPCSTSRRVAPARTRLFVRCLLSCRIPPRTWSRAFPSIERGPTVRLHRASASGQSAEDLAGPSRRCRISGEQRPDTISQLRSKSTRMVRPLI